MEVPSRGELRKLKVVELRQRLSKLSLPQGGIKEDLISRLIKHYEEERDAAEQEKQEQEEPGREEEKEVSPAAMMVSIDVGKGILSPSRDPHPTEAEETTPLQEAAVTPPEEVAIPPKQVEATPPTQSSEEAMDTDQVAVDTGSAAAPPNELTMPTIPSRELPVTTPLLAPETTPPDDYEDTDAMEVVSAPPPHMDQPLPQESIPQVPPVTTAPAISPPPQVDQPLPQMTEIAPPPQAPSSSVAAPPTVPEVTPPEQPHPQVTTPPVTDKAPELAPPIPVVAPPSHITTAQGIAPPLPTTRNVSPPSQPLPLMTTPTSIPDYYSGSDSGIGGVAREEENEASADSEWSHAVTTPPSSSLPIAPTESTDVEKKEKRKRKKKKRRRRRHDQQQSAQEAAATKEPDVEIEYVQEDILKPGDPNYRQFHKILESFRISDPAESEPSLTVSQLVAQAAEKSKKLATHKEESSDESEEENEKEEPKMSKKKLRKLNRLTVAQLKQLVERPDVVEMHDVTAMDPKLLIHLKSTRNTVSVPRHWCFKRKYLQGKRGIEKPPFDLPDFIKSTGVMEMRQALEDKEDAKSLKQKTRERVRPKMGKLTIDYQKLHDAFFKWQTKPKMSIHGDMYYEGKEFETRLRQKKPGDLSDELRRALGMPTGLGKHKFPPPWLVAMQRYGPPPSYPNLKIPGLNAAIPENCSFGYFVGGWGKPPVDEVGRPLYGDVFGLEQQEVGHGVMEEEEVDKTLWGELESEEEEEEDEDEESEEEGSPRPEDIAAGLVTPMEGLVTPSGLTSIPAGMETPDMIQLRKKKIEEAMEQGGETPALYTVIPEKPTSVGGAMMGSSHAYDVATAASGAPKKANAVEVALDPSELDLDTATIAARYEEQVREKRNAIQKEDLSDMVAEHAAKQKKRKRAAGDSAAGGKAAKKLKEFKF